MMMNGENPLMQTRETRTTNICEHQTREETAMLLRLLLGFLEIDCCKQKV